MEPDQLISGHDDETSEWLWDLEDRYDLGAFDDPAATVAGPAGDTRVASVKRHRRLRNGAEPIGASAGAFGDMDTRPVAVTGIDGPRHVPPTPPPPARHTNRLTIAAVVLVVLGLGAGEFYLATHRSRPRSSAISTPGTSDTTLGPPGVGILTQPSTSTGDTTATTAPGTTAAAAAAAGAAGAAGGAALPPGTTTPAAGALLTTTGTTIAGRPVTGPASGGPGPTTSPSPPATQPHVTTVTAPPPSPKPPPTSAPATTTPTLPPKTTVPTLPPTTHPTTPSTSPCRLTC